MKQSEILMRLGIEMQNVLNSGVNNMRDLYSVEDFETEYYGAYFRICGIVDAGSNLLTDKRQEVLERLSEQMISKLDTLAPALKKKAEEREKQGDGEQ